MMDGTGSFVQGQLALARWRDLQQEVERDRRVDVALAGQPRHHWTGTARRALGGVLRTLGAWLTPGGARQHATAAGGIKLEPGVGR